MVALLKEEKERYSPRLLDARNDVVFKAIFGRKRNEELLLLLLNSVLDEEIEEITFMDTHLGVEYVDEKYSVLDIRVRTAEKMEIDVEMQLEHHAGFGNRMLLYWAKMYVGQLKSGEKYSKLNKTIQISIVDFNFLNNEYFHSIFHIMEKEKRISFTDHLEIHVLELPKVNFSEKLTDRGQLTKWMLFLSGDDKTKEALAMEDIGIEKAYNELRRVSEDEVMRERAIARDKFLSDLATRRALAMEEGLEKGLEEGLKKGLEKGLEKGREEGIEIGLEKGARIVEQEHVMGMYQKGYSIAIIADALNLTEEKVNSIISPMQ